MKYTSFVFGILVTLLMSAATQAELIDNPQYISWAKQKVGTNVTSQVTAVIQGKTLPAQEVRTLKEITPEKATVEVVRTADSGTKQQTVQIPSKIEKGQEILPLPQGMNATFKEIGKEMIDIGGKKYDCTKYEFTGELTQPTAQIKYTGTVWNSTEIPGNLGKSVIHMGGSLPADVDSTITTIESK